MASGVTNRGALRFLEVIFRALFNGGVLPTNYYARLITDAVAPTQAVNVVGDVTEVPAGNGYTAGGQALAKNATDFDVLTEDDVNNRSLIQIKDVVFTAAGGSLPSAGTGARYAVITDDNAVDASREVLGWFDLGANRIVSDGQSLTIQNMEFRLTT